LGHYAQHSVSEKLFVFGSNAPLARLLGQHHPNPGMNGRSPNRIREILVEWCVCQLYFALLHNCTTSDCRPDGRNVIAKRSIEPSQLRISFASPIRPKLESELYSTEVNRQQICGSFSCIFHGDLPTSFNPVGTTRDIAMKRVFTPMKRNDFANQDNGPLALLAALVAKIVPLRPPLPRLLRLHLLLLRFLHKTARHTTLRRHFLQ